MQMEPKELVGCEPHEHVPLEDPSTLEAQILPVADFFQNNTCYDFLPNSSEVVVVDIDLKLQHAFSVAQDNNVTFASLWDSQQKKLCGMLTITDYVKMLLHFRDDPEGMQEFWNLPIRTWYQKRTSKPTLPSGDIIHCSVEDSLYQALRLLHIHKIHRLPTLHGGNLLHAVCRPSILGYFVANYPMDATLFSHSISDLKIGTFGRIFTGTPQTPLFTLLDTCVNRGISAVPIVNEDGRLLDVFSRYDVMNLAVEAEHSLDSTIADVNAAYPSNQVFTCTRKDTLREVLQHLMRTGAQRLVCINESKAVEGIISVGDIFDFFVGYGDNITKDPESPKPEQS
mmetsp:Transcript_87146/g.151628  ORF Transcript_87146/g.151628 Transcript_87146/m.151628 type:complete len:340 (-) Transcript_87146:489-1508(-)